MKTESKVVVSGIYIAEARLQHLRRRKKGILNRFHLGKNKNGKEKTETSKKEDSKKKK